MKKNYSFLFLFLLVLSVHFSNAQSTDERDNVLRPQLNTYKLKAGDTYTQTYLNDHLGGTLQVRARQRISFAQIAKKSLPFLAGVAYGVFGGKSKSLGQEGLTTSDGRLPAILGGAAISTASFALKPAKKSSVKLVYRNAIGQVIHTENRLIKTGKKIDISLWRSRFESVDVSVTAPANQNINVQQGAGRVAAGDSSSNPGGPQTNSECTDPNGDCPPSEFDDNYNDYIGSLAKPYQYYGFYNEYADSGLNNVGGNTFYYSGSSANGAGYYSDPSFTEPGGAGYYPMDNPGPAPVNGPGLYPYSRQAEVYQFMWNQMLSHQKEQGAFMTDKGLFLLPDTKNSVNETNLMDYPGIKVQSGYNGQQMFIYKNVEYKIEAIVHTHPPNSMYPGAAGLSVRDSFVSDYFKAPIFAITEYGIYRGRPSFTSPGENIFTDYTKIFDKDWSISNLNGWK